MAKVLEAQESLNEDRKEEKEDEANLMKIVNMNFAKGGLKQTTA